METLSEFKRKRLDWKRRQDEEHERKIQEFLDCDCDVYIHGPPTCCDDVEMIPDGYVDSDHQIWWTCDQCDRRVLADTKNSMEKKLKNLRKEVREGRSVQFVGLLCDHCHAELINPSPGLMEMTFPPKVMVACLICGWTGSEVL